MEESDTLQSVEFGSRLFQEFSKLTEEEIETVQQGVDMGVDVICNIISAIGPWQKVRLLLQPLRSLKTIFVQTPTSKGKVEFYVRKPPESKELHILLENVEAKRAGSQPWPPTFGQKTKTSGVGFSTIKHLQNYARDEGYSEFRFLVHNLRHQSSSESLVPPQFYEPRLQMNGTGMVKQGPTVNKIPETISRAYRAMESRYQALPTEIVRHPLSGETIVCYAYQIPSSNGPHWFCPLHYHLKEEMKNMTSHTVHASRSSQEFSAHGSHSNTLPLHSISSTPRQVVPTPAFPISDPLRAWNHFLFELTPRIQDLNEKGKQRKITKRKPSPSFRLPTWNYLSLTPQLSLNLLNTSEPQLAPRVTPQPQSLLQRRILEQPKRQNDIHTQVIQQQTGTWHANQITCHIGPDGNVWTVDLNTKELKRVNGDTSALRSHLQPYNQCLLPPGAHFAYPGRHKEIINPHSIPMRPPQPPIRQRYCGKIFDGLTRSWKEDKCNKCAQSGFPGAHCDQSF